MIYFLFLFKNPSEFYKNLSGLSIFPERTESPLGIFYMFARVIYIVLSGFLTP